MSTFLICVSVVCFLIILRIQNITELINFLLIKINSFAFTNISNVCMYVARTAYRYFLKLSLRLIKNTQIFCLLLSEESENLFYEIKKKKKMIKTKRVKLNVFYLFLALMRNMCCQQNMLFHKIFNCCK